MSSEDFNIESLPRWVRQIAEKAAQPGFERWRQMVAGAGGCTAPIRLVGNSTTVDADTGEVLDTYSTRDEPTEYLLVACGNRRASRCEPCASVYADDTFHLIRSGLIGGRDIPQSVTKHPIVFATFTAPSFGAVHSRIINASGAVKPCHPSVRDHHALSVTRKVTHYSARRSIQPVTTTLAQCYGTIAQENCGTCSRCTYDEL
jgi:hypothetical protein